MKHFVEKQRVFSFAKDNAGILIVCFFFLLIGSLSLDRLLIYTPDSARYLAWSQSLAHVEGFRDETTPEPAKYVVHAPLYSILLAPTAWLSATNAIPAKILTTAFGVALIGILYWWSKMRIGKWWAVLLCSLLAVHPAMVLYSTQVLSDVPFAVCVLLFFGLIEKALTAGTTSESYLIGLTATIVCGLFLREVGLALVLSCTVILILTKNYRTAYLILAVSVGFYALWYVRNEILVASVEHPALQNTQVFFRHLFTPSDVSMVGEFGARLSTNASVYGINMLRLPFAAETIFRSLSTMAPSQFPIDLTLALMPYTYHGLFIATIVLMIAGAYDEFKHRMRFLILAGFLLIYLIPVLLYPINDVRFLFPLLVVVLYLSVVGFKLGAGWLFQFLKRPNAVPWFASISFAVLALPNTAWTITYTGNNWRYERSPLGFFEAMRRLPAYPALYSRPIDLAGKWIAEHSDKATIVMSRWKELGLYTEGRKVLDADPQTLLDPFENMLRDYDVRYIVTVVSKGGLREFEQLFARTDKFHFEVAYRIADLEVVRVLDGPEDVRMEGSVDDTTEHGIEVRFARALRLLENDKPAECERMLDALPVQVRKQIPVLLNIAIAKEFEGNLAVASTMFEQFRNLQQAGSVVQPAWHHLEIISRLKEATKSGSASERAQRLRLAAEYYWVLGFRNQSVLTLDKSIEADSTFFPSLVFRAIYSYQMGDILHSRHFLALASQVDATNSLVEELSQILNNLRMLGRRHDRATRLKLQMDNVVQLTAMGLREDAIDRLLSILSENPNDVQCLRLLSDLYYEEGRYAPSLQYLRRLSDLRPDDPVLQKEIGQLVSRW